MTQDDRNGRPEFSHRGFNLRRMLWVLYGLCLLLLATDFVYHRHVSHPWEALPGFYALFGLGACVLLAIVARQMRRLLMRPEDYYDRDA